MYSPASHLGGNQLISDYKDRNQFANNPDSIWQENQRRLTHWGWEEDAEQACGYVRASELLKLSQFLEKVYFSESTGLCGFVLCCLRLHPVPFPFQVETQLTAFPLSAVVSVPAEVLDNWGHLGD